MGEVPGGMEYQGSAPTAWQRVRNSCSPMGNVFVELFLGARASAQASEGRSEHVVERGAKVRAIVHVAEDAGVEITEGLDDFIAEGCGVLCADCVAAGDQGDVVEKGTGFMEGEGEGDCTEARAGLGCGEVEGVIVPAGIEGEGFREEAY